MKTIDLSTKINRKTGKDQYTTNFYINEHGKYQRGKLPPVTHLFENPDTTQTTKIKVCKFCWNELPELEDKGHDRIFCDSDNDCANLYWKIRNLIKEKKKKEPDIIAIIWEPIKIKQEFWDKAGKFYPPQYKIPERINMKIVREGKPNREDWEVLTTRRRTPKRIV